MTYRTESNQHCCLFSLTELANALTNLIPTPAVQIVNQQTELTSTLVKQGDWYDARMSLYQVQNRLSDLYRELEKQTEPNWQALATAFKYMSDAGRPMGDELAPKTAMHVDVRKAVTV